MHGWGEFVTGVGDFYIPGGCSVMHVQILPPAVMTRGRLLCDTGSSSLMSVHS